MSRSRLTAARLTDDQSLTDLSLTLGLLEKSGWPVRTSSGAELTRNTAMSRLAGLVVDEPCVGPHQPTVPLPSTNMVELVRPVPAALARPLGSVEML